jgi:hypothetical protein
MLFGVGGATRVIIDVAYTRSTVPVYVPDGSAAAPTYGFITQGTWGMFRVPAIGIGFAVSGAEVARLAAAGLQFPAGVVGVTHNDTANYIAMCAAATVSDGNARVICFDSNHATTPKQVHLCGDQIIFADDAASTQRGRFTAATGQGELLVGINHSAALNSASGRGLIEIDGTNESLLSLCAANAKVGFVQGAPGGLNIGTQVAVPVNLKVNGTTVLACNTDGTVDISGIEAGWKSLPANVRTANYTLTVGDRGKHVRADSPTTLINAPGSVFAAGDVVTIVNNTSGNISIAATASLALQLAGTTASGTRTLATHGVANILWLSALTAIITGMGLS